ncbi:MAG: PcfJ domain-containing protein, partial [Oscillospiraceae bacterium]
MERLSADEIMSGLPDLPEDFWETCLDTVLPHSKYIFYIKKGSKDYGYCTHHRRWGELLHIPTHNISCFCPLCHETHTAKAMGYGTGKIKDYGNVAIFQKAKTGTGIYIQTFRLNRRYEKQKDFDGYVTSTEVVEGINESKIDKVYFFDYGEIHRIEQKWQLGFDGWQPHWHELEKIREPFLYDGNPFHSTEYKFYPYDEETFKGTCLEHSHFNEYINIWGRTNRIQYLAKYIKYPNLEHLVEKGYSKLINGIVSDVAYVKKALNFKEKKIHRILGLNRNQAEFVKAKNFDVMQLRIYKFLLKNNLISDNDYNKINEVERLCLGHSEINRTLEKQAVLIKYLFKQLKSGSCLDTMYEIYLDYLKFARQLGYELNSETAKYPPKLEAMHDRVARICTAKANSEKNIQFAKREKELSKFSFCYDDLFIRPCRTVDELVQEGQLLDHCVGGYVDSVADGSKSIFFLRKMTEPHKPFYTVDLDPNTGKIIQNHGYGNENKYKGGSPIPQYVLDWVELWHSQVLAILKA